ncbi:MAG: hypothetical protein LBS35_09495 [Synergistaceae bacterium]|jgi:uroporphyrinogen-III decarboxylase|nr:hypothetical protein [Synergistaceae bacterium]
MFKDADTQKLYDERFERYTAAMCLGTPDRIPIRFLVQEAAARYCGYTTQQVACDYNLAFEATRKMAEELGFDAVMLNAIWSNYGVAKSASWRYLFVPGVDVNINSVNQFGEPSDPEDIFLQVDEYDEFIDDPTAFLVNKWFPRATTRVKFAGQPVDFDHNTALMSGALAYANYMNAFGPAAAKLKYESGLVGANSGMIKAPLDILADKFRGYMDTAVDTVERPETVLRACEALMPHIVANALGAADPGRDVPITIWAHRGCVPFFSQETFDRIFWPTLKPVFEEIISHGYKILFYGEGNWEKHYDALKELPAGSIVYHLDKGDPAYAAKKFKGYFAISGGLPYDVLSRGTPDDVRRETARLFEVMKPGGGYILDCTALMLNDIDPANVKAAVDYTLEHGVYSRTSPRPERKLSPHRDIPQGKRPPGVVRPWKQESESYRDLSGDTELVKRKWQECDAALYGYLWTTVLW